jgi:ubiquinone/menaquinone biosynthesis C-methylase UbiE
MNTQAWYRRIAAIYDPICRPLFAGPRRAAVDALELQPGQTVLDLCTGTGLNLPLLHQAVGTSGKVIGVDFSPQMLNRAQRRVALCTGGDGVSPLNGESNVQLHQADAGGISSAKLMDWIGQPTVDAVLCTFGLAVAPNWQQIRANAWQLLKPGGRFAIADNQPFRRFPLRAINFPWVQAANLSGAAEIRRPTWELPEHAEKQKPRQDFLAGFVFVTAGSKPAESTVSSA